MPTRTGTAADNLIDLRVETAVPPAGWPATQAWWEVNALAGNDTVHGSAYNDLINGGEDNDILWGYDGNDSLRGDTGDDELHGGNGTDNLLGGSGDDFLFGDAGNDTLNGGDWNDTLSGGTGNDTLIGGSGGDTMLGGSGNDTFFGDAGNDVMKGEAGSDRLWGGAGNDQYHFNGSGVDVVNDGVTNTGSVRTGTVYDTSDRLYVSFTAADWAWEKKGNDLWVVSKADFAADGDFDNYVIVDDFFLGGHHAIEKLHTSDGAIYDLLTIL